MAGTSSGVAVTKNGDDVDVVLYQGKTVNFEVIWGGSSPIDVSGFAAKLQARESSSSSEVLAEFSSANSRISVGGADGKFTVSMSATDSAALKACVGIYDFEITDGAGNVHLVISGKFQIVPEVSR